MGNIFSHVCDPQLVLTFLCGKGEDLHNLEENLEALQKEMQELNTMMNDLLRKISKEEGRVVPEVSMWISMFEETEVEASRLLDGSISVIQRLSMYGYCSRFSASTDRYSNNVVLTLEAVRNLISKGGFERATLPYVLNVPRPHQPIVSQGKLLESTWDRLMDENVGTLGIYGMPGVGKTTLLEQINYKFSEHVFDLVIYAVVACTEVEDIQDRIGRKLGLQWGRETRGAEKAGEIFAVLEGKRFVLLLDDIQMEDNLAEIGVPCPSRENGCKIVFTTCHRGGSKGPDAEVQVNVLSSEEAWGLLQKTVGVATLRSHPEIPKLARIVAEKCGGLPLTLIVVGRRMASRRTVEEWRHAIHVLVTSSYDSTSVEDNVLPILRFTCDALHNERISQCFIYCALFPEDSVIRRGDLVDYWVGEGMVSDEIKGYEVLSDLVGANLLMVDGTGYGVKMNSKMRAMALRLTSDNKRQKELVVVGGGEKIEEEVNDWRVVRRMSVTSTQIENISVSPNCSELRTLFLQGNDKLRWISGDFFRRMINLVVLNMSCNSEISELPEEVSSLVSLQLLNLSWTSITHLPIGLKNLASLVHLDLEHTRELKFIKVELLVGLLKLKALRLLGSLPMDHLTIELLECFESLKDLSLTVTRNSVLDDLLRYQRLASCTRRLSIRDILIPDGEITLLNVLCSLCELEIRNCRFRKRHVYGRRSNIDEIPHFRHLGKVSFYRCEDLKDLTWVLYAPCLADLSLYECVDTKEIISKEKAMDHLGHTSEQPFQNLTRLVLFCLPKLESIYWNPLPFPVLGGVEIRFCPNLKRLPFDSESAKGNQVRLYVDEEWMEGAEWEDEATKHHFSNLRRLSFDF